MSQKKKEQHWASTSRYDTGELLRDLDGGADTYSLEEILAEYGHGGVEDLTLPEEQEAKAATESAQEPVREQKAAPAPKPVPEEPRRETKASEPEPQESPEEPEEAEEPQEEQVPESGGHFARGGTAPAASAHLRGGGSGADGREPDGRAGAPEGEKAAAEVPLLPPPYDGH